MHNTNNKENHSKSKVIAESTNNLKIELVISLGLNDKKEIIKLAQELDHSFDADAIITNSNINKYFNKNTFPYSKKINFNSLRKGKVVGEHEVKFSSGKEIITLNHEAFDRALYSEGALTAAKWLMSKKPGLYSMRNVLNFK